MIKIYVCVIAVLFASYAIFQIWRITKQLPFKLTDESYIDGHLKYQLVLFCMALSVVGVAVLMAPKQTLQILTVGDIKQNATITRYFGIGANYSWLEIGLLVWGVITAGTVSFVVLKLRRIKISLSSTVRYVKWIVILALLNSLSEELIFRVAVVGPMLENIEPSSIALVSAILFGIAHFGGMPHGLIGMLMAGILGWVLAYTIIDTHGIALAWLVHFTQDVVIYFGMIIWYVQDGERHQNYFGG